MSLDWLLRCRVPATEIGGFKAGELFVHRNIANQLSGGDHNSLAVVQYAVEVLKVRYIIVCGHYRCGGVEAAMSGQVEGALGKWLAPLRDIIVENQEELESIPDPLEREDRLCELNVKTQVDFLRSLDFVQAAWKDKEPLSLHGWIFDLQHGRLRDLDISVSMASDMAAS